MLRGASTLRYVLVPLDRSVSSQAGSARTAAHLLAWALIPVAVLGADDLAFMYLTRPQQACNRALTAVTGEQARLDVVLER